MATVDDPAGDSLADSLVILDVGHGNAAVLLDSGSVVIFDAGPGSILLEFLREQNISHVDTVLLSHADNDHIGGLNALLSSGTVTIGKVRANTDSLKDSNAWDDLTFELSCNSDVDFQPVLTTENSGEFDTSEVTIEIAAPSSYLASRGAGSTDRKNRRLDTNSLSAVVRLKYKGKSFALLPGDLDLVGLQNAIDDGRDMAARMIVFPHHGGRPGTIDFSEFVQKLFDAVAPSFAIFSISRGKHGTPRPELIEAIRTHFPSTRIACSQLSEHCSNNVPEFAPPHLSDVHAHGKTTQSCCMGTIIYQFKDAVMLPTASEHLKFIELAVESPLCQIEYK